MNILWVGVCTHASFKLYCVISCSNALPGRKVFVVWWMHYTKSPPRMQCWGVRHKKYITLVLKKASRFCCLFHLEGAYIFTSKTCSIHPAMGHPVGCCSMSVSVKPFEQQTYPGMLSRQYTITFCISRISMSFA